MGRTVRKRRLLRNKHKHMCLRIKRTDDANNEASEVKEDGLPQEEGREEAGKEKVGGRSGGGF